MTKNWPVVFFLFLTFQSLSQNILEKKTLIHSAEVYFDFALFDIRPDADSTLAGVVEFCADKEEIFIKITAHTDAIGTKANNVTLSENRVNVVKNHLAERGISEDRMETSFFGETRPQATNDTDDGRQLNRRATIDIFQTTKFILLSGTVADEDTGQTLEATVIVRTKDSKDSIFTDATGHFEKLVPLGAVVGIDAFTKCYFLKTRMLKATPEAVGDVKMKMRPAKVGKAADIENLYFVGNQDTLLKKSEPELPKILHFMELNDCLKIKIAGHVNVPNAPPVTKHSWEYNLSVRRAKRVYNYLLENGIGPDRLTYEGFGNWQMRFPKATRESEQAQNRRVEIRVMKGSEECLCGYSQKSAVGSPQDSVIKQ